ncbi:dicarboxylate/amino acid:cation symporter [Undibacterium sp. TJN25]|uniref:dicarboxylate/amino acid:cation symporter n=1 Tax=Undibacterium sp. TJN25 TaxID=3413056 RepID=UPI003BEF5A3E
MPTIFGESAVKQIPFYTKLYFQVLMGIAIGITVGFLAPEIGVQMKPLGDSFIKFIKMMISPIIFVTVVVGIAKMGDLKEVGRVGLKSILYFELVSTIAMVIGLIIVNVFQPGSGMHVDVKTLDVHSISTYTSSAQHASTVDFLMNIIPTTVVDAFAKGETLQVLLFAIMFGMSLTFFGDKVKPLIDGLDMISNGLFGVIGIIMKLAPIGAFGAIAFTIGKYGIGSLKQLSFLMVCMYATCVLFIFGVLGLIAKLNGFNIFKFLNYIREEIFIVLGTSTSESVLPRLMVKLEKLGCQKSVVGLVIPTGYSFNLDGTSIYLTMAAIFIAQATDVDLTLGEQLGILGILLLTSKGAASVVGASFVTLAATLASMNGKIPVEGLVLLVGIDRFMAEARSITNVIGNAVATVVVSNWDGALDRERMSKVLDGDFTEVADDVLQAGEAGLLPEAAPVARYHR